MKTIEEKAKAYDEALERAKKMTSDLTNLQAIREFIFPELRESEDERINKAIFKALSKKEARDVLLAEGVQVSDALAYLEKQKEQKPEWSEEDKETIELLKKILEVNHPNGMFKTTEAGTTNLKYISTDEVVSRIESLRPSRKLSEDQIYTLEHICSNLHLRASDDAPKLDEIIEQLKQK